MNDAPEPQDGAQVLWAFMMSLDGFVAGADHDMSWMTDITVRPGVLDAYMETTGAVLAGRDGFDGAINELRPWGGHWKGPIFVLTHHPDDAPAIPDVTFVSCPVEEAVRIALEAAAGKNVCVFSTNIGAQLLDLDLIDEIDIHIAPLLLGEGIRLYDRAGKPPIRLSRVDVDDPESAARVRYRPLT